MTDEHLNHYADRYVRHGLRDCGVSFVQYLADPGRYAPLESLLPRQRIAAGKAMAERSMPIERVAIEPPVWCHQCGAMLARRVTLSGSTATAACPECAARSEAAILRRTAPTSVTLWDECNNARTDR